MFRFFQKLSETFAPKKEIQIDIGEANRTFKINSTGGKVTLTTSRNLFINNTYEPFRPEEAAYQPPRCSIQ